MFSFHFEQGSNKLNPIDVVFTADKNRLWNSCSLQFKKNELF